MSEPNYPTKTWIRERFDYWQKRLLLQHWDINLYITDSKSVDEDENVGNANANPVYLMATVTIARKHTKDNVDATIVHELGHVITSDFVRKVRQLDLNENMKSMVRDMNENLVSQFANILMKIEEQHAAK